MLSREALRGLLALTPLEAGIFLVLLIVTICFFATAAVNDFIDHNR